MSKGTIVTYSVVQSATEYFKHKTPYVMALVEENGQVKLSGIEGYSPDLPIAIGMEVEALTSPDTSFAYKFIS